MRPIRCAGLLLAVAILAAGCATSDDPTASAPSDPGLAGKTGPGAMSGRTSPVPAFKGGGEHFSIDIRSIGDGDHQAELVWGSGSGRASGVLRYNGPVADAPGSLIVLSGELALPEGARPVTVEIKRERCTDESDRMRMHVVQVYVQDLDRMRGCGDMAQY